MRSFATAAVALLSLFTSSAVAGPTPLDPISNPPLAKRGPNDPPPYPLTTAQRLAFNPFIRYASAAYCFPDSTLAWSCGPDCQGSNPQFKPIASGGNGATVQYWYVGWDPLLNVPGSSGPGAIVVGYQGTDTREAAAVLNNYNVAFGTPSQTYFPGISSDARIHTGFRDAHARSATVILNAVKAGIARYGAKTVVTTGHSLGAALSIIGSVSLKLTLPSSLYVSSISFAAPRTGNTSWATFVDNRVNYVRHVGNKQDAVPVLPSYTSGYRQPNGEVHIRTEDSVWVYCPGQDNFSTQCSTGAVPNIFVSRSDRDHNGPYGDVAIMGNQCTPNPYA